MTPAESPRRIQLLTALLLVGTFAAGVVTGAGVLRGFAPAAPAPSAPPPLATARLPRELRLTPAQEEQARAIGERYRPELEALAREVRPRVRAVQDRMEGELVALLTPEQRKELEEIAQRRRNPPRAGEPAGPAPGPPPPDGAPRGPRDGGPGRRPPPQEAIDACAHLDVDRLCTFTHDGREHEGSCRLPPDGHGPLACAPDRSLEPPPPDEPRR